MFQLHKSSLSNQPLIVDNDDFSAIYSYKDNEGDSQYSVQIIRIKDEKQLWEYFEKILLAFSCEHKNILKLYGYFIEKTSESYLVYLKLPYMKETLLQKMTQVIKDGTILSEAEFVRYFYSLLCCYDYLHKKDIACRNVKLEDIFLDQNGELKLSSSFKFAKYLESKAIIERKNLNIQKDVYLAPELEEEGMKEIQNKDLFKADAWSLGILLMQICLGQVNCYQYQLPLSEREIDLKRQLKKIEDFYRSELVNLISELLQTNPNKRKDLQYIKIELEKLFGEQVILGCLEVSNRMPGKKAQKEEEKKIDNMESQDSSQEKEEEIINQLQKEWEGKFKIHKGNINQVEINQNFEESKIKKLFIEVVLDGKRLFSRIYEKKEGSEEITDEDVRFLSKKLANLKSLQQLTLDFDGCKEITDDGVNLLSETIANNFHLLKRLSVNFTGCTRLTDESMKSASSIIGNNLKSLEQLTLNFGGCKKMTDEGLKNLSINIAKNFQSLKQLILNFNRCEEITDKGLEQISNNITNITSLELLTLNFVCCTKISDEGLDVLSSYIAENLQCLQDLTLLFACCSKITDQGVKSLANNIANNMTSLKQLSLNFNQCPKITEEVTKSVLILLYNFYLKFSY